MRVIENENRATRLKKISIILIIMIVVSINIASFASPPDITAETAVLYYPETGMVLYDKNMHQKMYPASTTKILTAMIILENHELDEKITIDKETPFTEGSRIYVLEDEIFTVEEMLYALMLQSANDAAVALAKHHSGSTEDFAKVMTDRAHEIGAVNSNFVTPNGLHDDNHYTTAYDLALIASEAMKNHKFREIVTTLKYNIEPTNVQTETRYLFSKNKFLVGLSDKKGSSNKMDYRGKTIPIEYDIMDGVKTGYTSKAGQCFVGSAYKDNVRLISVVLKSDGNQLWTDTRALIDFGYENYTKFKVISEGETVHNVKIPKAKNSGLNLVAEDSVTVLMDSKYENQVVEPNIVVNEEILAPITKGDVLGYVEFSIQGELLGKTNLVAERNIDSKDLLNDLSLIFTNNNTVKDYKYYIALAGKFLLAFVIWRILVSLIRSGKRRRL